MSAMSELTLSCRSGGINGQLSGQPAGSRCMEMVVSENEDSISMLGNPWPIRIATVAPYTGIG